VTWPDGPGNRAIQGREAFREHWTRRLEVASLEVDIVRSEVEDGWLVVDLHEVVSSRLGRGTFGEYQARRRFAFRDGLIAEMRRGY
jgi:hypothetical protein